MAYIPDWDTLAEAQARVTACGYSISESERDICCALRDGKLHQRYRLIGVRTPYGSEVSRRAIGQPRGPSDLRDIIGWPHVPVDLSPDDIDWENSRPKRPWRDARGFIVDIDKIEVSTKDVIRILCSGPSGVSSARQHLSSKSELPEASLVNETADEPAVEAAAEPVVETVAVPALEAGAKTPLSAAEETRAAIALEKKLKEKPELSKAEATDFFSDLRLALSGRPFQRVWENARVRAGLPREARRGRKPKSPR